MPDELKLKPDDVNMIEFFWQDTMNNEGVMFLCSDWRTLTAQNAALEAELSRYQEVAQKEQEPGGVLDKWMAVAGELQAQVAALTDERDGFRAEALSALSERDTNKLRLKVKAEQLSLARLAVREIYTYIKDDLGFSEDDMRCVISASSVVQLDAALKGDGND